MAVCLRCWKTTEQVVRLQIEMFVSDSETRVAWSVQMCLECYDKIAQEHPNEFPIGEGKEVKK